MKRMNTITSNSSIKKYKSITPSSRKLIESTIKTTIRNANGELWDGWDNSYTYVFDSTITIAYLCNSCYEALRDKNFKIISHTKNKIEIEDSEKWYLGAEIRFYIDPDNDEDGKKFISIDIIQMY